MLKRFAMLLAFASMAATAHAQPPTVYKSAVVALTDDVALRQSFESELAALARSHAYDAVTSYDITSDVESLDRDEFLQALAARGIQAVLMVRPAAVGEGSSLESVRNEVSSRAFEDMQRFVDPGVSQKEGVELTAEKILREDQCTDTAHNRGGAKDVCHCRASAGAWRRKPCARFRTTAARSRQPDVTPLALMG